MGRATAATLPYWEPYAARTADSASSEPTERSIPPPMMTNVMPTAIRPRNELASRMFRKLSTLANRVPNTSDAMTVTDREDEERAAALEHGGGALAPRGDARGVVDGPVAEPYAGSMPSGVPVAAVTTRSAGAG